MLTALISISIEPFAKILRLCQFDGCGFHARYEEEVILYKVKRMAEPLEVRPAWNADTIERIESSVDPEGPSDR